MSQFLIFVVSIFEVRADLPVHCLHHQVAGDWIFHIGRMLKPGSAGEFDEDCGFHSPDSPVAKDNHKDGGHRHVMPQGCAADKDSAQCVSGDENFMSDWAPQFRKVGEMRVNLGGFGADDEHLGGWHATSRPSNRSFDLTGEVPPLADAGQGEMEGEWTMIYNEGLHTSLVEASGFEHSLAAFNWYKLGPGGTGSSAWKENAKYSNCAQTLIGWYHVYEKGTGLSKIKDRLCWWGEQTANPFGYETPETAKQPNAAHGKPAGAKPDSKKAQELHTKIMHAWEQPEALKALVAEARALGGFEDLVTQADKKLVAAGIDPIGPVGPQAASSAAATPRTAMLSKTKTDAPSEGGRILTVKELLDKLNFLAVHTGHDNRTASSSPLAVAHAAGTTDMGAIQDQQLRATNHIAAPKKGRPQEHRDERLDVPSAFLAGVAPEGAEPRGFGEDFRNNLWTQTKMKKRDDAAAAYLALIGGEGIEEDPYWPGWDVKMQQGLGIIENMAAFDWRNIQLSGHRHSEKHENKTHFHVNDVDDRMTEGGELPRARDQGPCGSCYDVAMSTILTARLWIRYPELMAEWKDSDGGDGEADRTISWKHNLDCNPMNQGCEGGYPYFSLLFGQDREMPDSVSYPHKTSLEKGNEVFTSGPNQGKSMCTGLVNPEGVPSQYAARIQSFGYVGGVYGLCHIMGNKFGAKYSCESAMMSEMYRAGPIGVALEPGPNFGGFLAEDHVFECASDQQYEKAGLGSMMQISAEEPCPAGKDCYVWERVDHAIIAVGWGVQDVTGSDGSTRKVKYWIVQNSWGQKWNGDGTMKIVRGENCMSIESITIAGEPVLTRRTEQFESPTQVRTTQVDGQHVIAATSDDLKLQKGDIVVAVDGKVPSGETLTGSAFTILPGNEKGYFDRYEKAQESATPPTTAALLDTSASRMLAQRSKRAHDAFVLGL